jgi:hypothetical protein
MSQPEQSEFERRVRQVLIDSTDSLDGQTRSRLTQARHAALARGAAHSWLSHAWFRWSRWAPAGAAAMAVVVGVLLLGPRLMSPPTASPAATSAFDDIDLLADADGYGISADDQDMDYEFYEWAADQNGAASGLGT